MNLNRLREIARYYRQALRHAIVIDRRKLYAAWEQAQLKQLLAYLDVDCVFDVGANDGQYARMIRRKAGYTGLIVSFEPIPEAAAKLREMAKDDARWVVVEGALGEFDGEQVFNVMADSQFSSLSAPRADETGLFAGMNAVRRQVPVKTERLGTALDRLRREHGFERPFLKLDTQGYDVRIVRGAGAAVREFLGLQSELAVVKLYAESVDFREALSFYEQCGFTLSAFVPNNSGHFPRLVETDCIMIRSDLVPGGH